MAVDVVLGQPLGATYVEVSDAFQRGGLLGTAVVVGG